MLKSLCALVLLLSCSPGFAESQPASQQQSPAAKADRAARRVICQDEEVTGSRVASQRVCMTADQWKQHEQDARDVTDEQQRQGPHI